MTSYTVLAALAMLVCATLPDASLASPAGPLSDESRAPVASLHWTRAAPGGSVTVDAVPAGTDLAIAQADVRLTAVLLDAIRTFRPHVIWRRIRWEGGRMSVELVADSAIYANVATLALRRRFPGRSTAGTGIRQARRAVLEGYGWSVRFLLAARPPSSPP